MVYGRECRIHKNNLRYGNSQSFLISHVISKRFVKRLRRSYLTEQKAALLLASLRLLGEAWNIEQ